jgi:transposase
MADRVWSEKDLIRRANRRLAVLKHAEEVSGNVAATCRYYGISRNVFYRWKRRYEDEGLDGLKDRSSAPLLCPTITHPDVVEKIIHLRQHYHFGPMKIRMYLKRYHDVDISASGVWRILKRLGMNRLPASQRHKRHTGRWKRYEKQRPGHHVQIDVKFIEPITTGSGRRKRYYQYTAIDDCTRLRVLRAYPRLRPLATAFPGREDPDRQRRRIPVQLPLARARSRHRPYLHPPSHTQAERQSGAFTPHRRRRVLPTTRRCG